MKNKFVSVIYDKRKVGELALTKDGVCAFQYSPEWLANGFSISPIQLPLENKVFIAKQDPFDGNFGVFNDSLPDGWGRLLTDRLLKKQGIDPATVSVIDRLAIVGNTGAGALEYIPSEPLTNTEVLDSLDVLAREAEKILNEEQSGKLEELVRAGGSSGGARPKVLLSIKGEDWIVKFPASSDPKNIGELEFAYSSMAKSCDVEMGRTELLEGKYFAVKRFDRVDEKKVFMISVSGLLNASHRLPVLDYNDLMRLTFDLTRDMSEVEKMYRLMCFNVLTNNKDDHSKNFAFLYKNGKWLLSPAYDLVYSEGMGFEHATMVNGKGKDITDEDMLEVGKKIGLSSAGVIIGEVKNVVNSYKKNNPIIKKVLK